MRSQDRRAQLFCDGPTRHWPSAPPCTPTTGVGHQPVHMDSAGETEVGLCWEAGSWGRGPAGTGRRPRANKALLGSPVCRVRFCTVRGEVLTASGMQPPTPGSPRWLGSRTRLGAQPVTEGCPRAGGSGRSWQEEVPLARHDLCTGKARSGAGSAAPLWPLPPTGMLSSRAPAAWTPVSCVLRSYWEAAGEPDRTSCSWWPPAAATPGARLPRAPRQLCAEATPGYDHMGSAPARRPTDRTNSGSHLTQQAFLALP